VEDNVISKYGYTVVAGVILVAIAGNVLAEILGGNGFVKAAVLVLSLLLASFVFYFFRDPARISPAGDHLILSPADGKIVFVGNAKEQDFLGSDSTQISIFLSPFDVHINRAPISGKVRYFKYVKGNYLVAFHEKASEKNERAIIGIENGDFRVLMRQVAGFIARRIVCTLRVNDDVRAGERFGMIKFGSRVDVLIPARAEVKVGVNDRVVAGETVLAVYPS
jgi:phosphatidylserine decarboxylase